MVNLTVLKFSIPSALKWTAVADGIALVALGIKYIPPTILGVPTLPFVTIVSVALATWEAYAIRMEDAASAPAPLPSTPVPSSGAPSTSAPGAFTLTVSNSTAGIGDSVTYTLSGGATNGTAILYQVGLPQNNEGALSGTINLDSTGAGSWTANLSTAGPIGGVLNAEGSISLYALDSAGNESNIVTIS